jgi:hypothetical protein
MKQILIAGGVALILTAGASVWASAEVQAQQVKITNRNYVAASGKWKANTESAKPEDPAAKVRIECDKNIALCAVAEGANLAPDEGNANLFTRLDLAPVHYTILHWDATGLVAQTSARDCVTDRLVIDFRSKSVTMIQTPKGNNSDEDNEFCRVFTKTITSHLVGRTSGK